MQYVGSILWTVIFPWLSKATRSNENPKLNISFSSSTMLCLTVMCFNSPIHFIMHINQLPNKSILLTSEMCYSIYKLFIKVRKVAFFSQWQILTLSTSGFKTVKIEKLDNGLTLSTPVWQFFASNWLGDNLTVFYSHLRLPGYWNQSKCTLLCYYVAWDLNILLVRKHKNSHMKVLTTLNLYLKFTKKIAFISFPLFRLISFEIQGK